MHNWQENEIKELLMLRGSDSIRHQITGTVKDSVVYQRMTTLLAERGVYRSHMQIISKLKTLKKQYSKYHEQKTRYGGERVTWPFYDLCHRVFGPADPDIPVKRPRTPTPPLPSPSPPPPAPPPPPPPACTDDHQQVVVGLWDDVTDGDINKHLGEEEEEERYSSSEQLQSVTYTVPQKKKKTTVMGQVSTLVSATVSQLREMDAAMQAQEDARLQRLMDHEKEMQKNLVSQLVAMHERISRENHERHLELVDRLLSRFPSAPSGP